MNKRRVLAVCTVPMARGNGVSAWILNMDRHIDRADLQLDYALINDPDPDVRAELTSRGGRIFVLPRSIKRPLRYVRALAKLVRREGYQVVHAHGNSCTLALDLLGAKLGGCKARMAHSHNTQCRYARLNKLLRPAFDALCTRGLACGEDAGRWLFRARPFEVLPVAVDADKYAFDPARRSAVRNRLQLGSKTAICCVGGLIEQKNHAFLLRAFQKALALNPNLVLVLAGAGALEAELRAQTQSLNLANSVRFLGLERDVPALLQAMDVAVLPSLFEGFPTVALEAQCAGLPLLLSENITNACKITPWTRRLPLNIDTWAEEMAKTPPLARETSSAEGITCIRRAGFDVRNVAARLREIYLQDDPH